MKSHSKHSPAQVLRFCLAGGLAIAAQYAALYIGIQILHLQYLIVAFVASLLNLYISFQTQKKWTFKNKSKENEAKQIRQFLILRVPMIILNSPFLWFLTERCSLPVFAGQAVLTIFFSIISYFVSAKIFTPKAPQPV